MVCLLLESGADINLNTKLGTALVMAGRYETEPTLTNFLLANGADPDLTGQYYTPPNAEATLVQSTRMQTFLKTT